MSENKNTPKLGTNQSAIFADFPDIVTPDELMVMLSTGRNSVYRLLKEGVIKGFRIGSRWKVPKQEVIRFLFNQ